MDMEETSKNTKGKACKGDKSARAKAISWPAAISEFVLDWYIEKKLELPAKSIFKKMHHTTCTSAINTKYGTTYSVDQVHRHFRRHKETWALVARYLNESGQGWDDDNKQLILSQSILDGLSANDRGVLSKPIQFFDKLKELFCGSSADGSFMQDHFTAAEFDNDNETNDIMDDMSTYNATKELEGQDSDKLETDSDDCEEVAALAATASHVSSSNVGALKPNKKNFKRMGKPNTLPSYQNDKAKKLKPKSSQASHNDNDMDMLLTNTLVGIKETLGAPIQTAAPKDPNAPLWDILKNIPMLAEERMAVGMHLCKPEFEVHRSFLVNMGEDYIRRWAFKFLSGDDPTGGSFL